MDGYVESITNLRWGQYLFRSLGKTVLPLWGAVSAARASVASFHANLFFISYLRMSARDNPGPAPAACRGVRMPANASDLKVNLSGYLDMGCRALPGLARGAPGASVGIGEQQVSILIAAAERALDGPRASGGGDDLIQAEKSYQEDSHEENGHQEVRPAGLQNDILHLRLQDAVVPWS